MSGRASLWRFFSGKASSGRSGGRGDPDTLGRKIHRTALILIGGGFLFCLIAGGWNWALGFGIGGGIAATNLELLRQTVGRALASETNKALPHLVGSSLLRLFGIGIVLFLVLKFLPVQVIGLALGLSVGPVAMVAVGYRGTDDLVQKE